MTFRMGSRTFWFLVMVLGERPSSPWASQSWAARILLFRLLLVGGSSVVHGKEKIYGSIP
jgi:hypothetical protein